MTHNSYLLKERSACGRHHALHQLAAQTLEEMYDLGKELFLSICPHRDNVGLGASNPSKAPLPSRITIPRWLTRWGRQWSNVREHVFPGVNVGLVEGIIPST